ncbi:unnamed protein product [Adineta steineri]|uniref:EGF-like domain-containing protein n=2 Tax=Adineta steineri TaxID=433720 RepID=A0A818ITQ5_9BILA|nr:unnamed protein product [Adineta steineri]
MRTDSNWFGTRCQYFLSDTKSEDELNEIINNQLGIKYLWAGNYDIIKDASLLTCYEGLRCHSTICLDWREICNGIFNCENGEDEPIECLSLETNECKDDEYRCRFGMCIPKTFLRDFSYDCMDLSDEQVPHPAIDFDDSCYMSSKLECDYRLCDVHEFSCSDGQCLSVKNWVQPCIHSSNCDAHCNNGRDLFLSENLLRLNLSHKDNRLNHISFQCWYLLLCNSVEQTSKFFGYNYKTCPCSKSKASESECVRNFHDYCPISFVFQTANNFLYPFVQLLYHNTSSSSSKWWLPTHLCYNSTHCPALRLKGLPLINNLLCVAREEFEYSYPTPWALMQLFSACTFAPTSILTKDKRLFYCEKSMKFVSKYKIYDGSADCLYKEDENWTSNDTIMHIVNMTDRFKCLTNNQWVSRRLIGKGYCLDGSDAFYLGICKRASDIACQFLRGLYIPPINYVFKENCDGENKTIFLNTNNTDETDCEEWPKYRRCDGYWDLSNGDDELNCSNTILSYITHTVTKCRANEHYCMFSNGTMGCLAKEYAGNGHVDCIGGTDERKTCASRDPKSLFQCSSGQCLPLKIICNEESDCRFNEDELICPWFYNVTHPSAYMFICKNGTAIKRAQWCNKIIDCQPDAEDEWFCDLSYPKTMYSLNFLEEYPPLVIDSSLITADKALQLSASLTMSTDYSFEFPDLIDDWYCNRGLTVTTKSSSVQCFCSPSYYGPRCQYQSERVLITLRVDTQFTLSGHENLRNAIRLIACLMFNDLVVHHEVILHVPLMKQMFYLNYPRPPPKQQGNWSVRLDAFLINAFSVNFIAAWNFDIRFSFLPFTRLVLHLMLQEQESCNTIPCVHGNCRKYLNSPHKEYCQCEQHWSGQYCNISTICSCTGGGQCLDRYRRTLCVCPLGRMGNDCHALFNPCNNIQCANDGTCIPLDERLPIKFICACRKSYYGPRCELANAYIDIYFSKFDFDYNRLLSSAAVVHFLESKEDSSDILFVQNRLLHKPVQFDKLTRVFNNGYKHLCNSQKSTNTHHYDHS